MVGMYCVRILWHKFIDFAQKLLLDISDGWAFANHAIISFFVLCDFLAELSRSP